jgi:hypothetical protein
VSYSGPIGQRRRRRRPQFQGLGYVGGDGSRGAGAIAAIDAVQPYRDPTGAAISYQRDRVRAQITRGITPGERARMSRGQMRAVGTRTPSPNALGIMGPGDGGVPPPSQGKTTVVVKTVPPRPIVVDHRTGKTYTDLPSAPIPPPTQIPSVPLPPQYQPLPKKDPGPVVVAPPPATPAPPPGGTPTAPATGTPLYSSSSGGGGGVSSAGAATGPTAAPAPTPVTTAPPPEETSSTFELPFIGSSVSPTMLAIGAAAAVGLVLLLNRRR